MQNILTLPLCQGRNSYEKNYENSNNLVSYGIIDESHQLSEVTMQSLEDISVAKAKEYLRKMLLPKKEAVQVFSNLEQLREAIKISNERNMLAEQLPANITETPKFYEVKSESTELSISTRDTFARIGERAREAFIEEQIERATFYNIPYKSYGENYYQLMVDIDKYEYLLGQAKDYCVDWDYSEYDLLALEQAIEEAEHNAYMQDQELRFYFSLTRGVEV
jgi:hypothetical protein